jgi:Glycosyl hydrolase catalytic core
LGSKKTCIALITIVLCVLAGTVRPQPAGAARGMLVGLYDPVQPIAAPETTFSTLVNLRAQIIRMNLDWNLIATKRPATPTDPADPAYHWSSYDSVLLNAAKNKIQVLFTIMGTPRWANGKLKGTNVAPRRAADLRYFALAAAKRYSGSFKRDDGTKLPAVRKWLAWNEPNNPVFLRPQWGKVGRRCTKVKNHRCVRYAARYAPVGAKAYVAICTAVWSGIHASHLAKEVVGCGATDPQGNNAARSRRPSISPTAFLQDLHNYGLKRAHFDVYAHHPYYSRPNESPAMKPKGKQTVTLGNISVLTKELGKLYGNKKLWITEYGYQTSPPDRTFGVSWTKQAKYLTQAYAIARKNPRITMMLWFLLRDEGRLSGWQSGLFTAAGKKKPAYNAFRRLPH